MSDDFDDDVTLDDTFDDFEKKDQTLGDMWRDNPLFKIGAIIAAVVVIFVVISFVTGEERRGPDSSYVGGAPNVSSAPGTDKATPAYI